MRAEAVRARSSETARTTRAPPKRLILGRLIPRENRIERSIGRAFGLHFLRGQTSNRRGLDGDVSRVAAFDIGLKRGSRRMHAGADG